MSEDNDTIEARHSSVDLAAADLNHKAWEHAQAVAIDRYWSGAAAPAGRHVEARILWSSKALHLRFSCQQTEPLVITPNPQLKEKTIGLWDRDVCEIFIAPDPNVVERYLEFEVSPTGEWLDVAIHWTPEKRKPDWAFQSRMTAAGLRTVTRGGKENDLEMIWMGMRIPWNDWMHQPQKGDTWRVNLFRCVGKDPDRGYLAWRPTRTPQPYFHVPKVFGWLVFN
jgi:Carbohydrate-binding family 9